MAVGPEAPEEKVARAHPDTTPSTKRLPSPSRGSPAGPRRPGGSRGAGPCPPCHPPPAPLEARAPSSQRHAAHPPRIIAAVAAFPQNAGLLPLSSPSPHSGVGGGDIFNTAPPPPLSPNGCCLAAVPADSPPLRTGTGRRSTPGQQVSLPHSPGKPRAAPHRPAGGGGGGGGAVEPHPPPLAGRFPTRDPRPSAEGKAERLPVRRAGPPPPPRAGPAAGEARCLDASPRRRRRRRHRLPQRRTAPSSCPVNGCRLTDRRGGHTGRQLPGVHL